MVIRLEVVRHQQVVRLEVVRLVVPVRLGGGPPGGGPPELSESLMIKLRKTIDISE